MGQFSWKTGDTKRSIHSGPCKCGFPVAMILPDNSRFIEKNYKGYGLFGNKDIYSVVSELNGFGTDRSKGIDIACYNDTHQSFKRAAELGYKLPKLAENLEANYKDLDYPDDCPDQGWVCFDECEEIENEI